MFRDLVYGAYKFILGKDPVLTIERDLALTYGVCSLKGVDDDDRPDHSAKRRKKCGYFVAKPLFVSVLVDGAARKFEEEELDGDAAVGFMLEEYFALKADEFGRCVANAVQRLGQQLERFAGHGNSLDPDTSNIVNVLISSQFDDYDEADALEREKRSVVIFPGTSMGPDLIIVLWDNRRPLVLLVQSKSGKHSSMPEAVRSLTQLYEEKRAEGKMVKCWLAEIPQRPGKAQLPHCVDRD